MSEYIFADREDDQELRRLQLIEQALDSETITRLQSTGIQLGWSCLELGAGAGSIAHWMREVVGDGGRVVAVDRNVRHFAPRSTDRLTVIEGDFLKLPLQEQFDLAHCRYVLIHNSHSQRLLEKLAGLLRPGGFLVVEEPDFTSARLLNTHADPSQQRVNQAICRMFEQRQLDPAFGLTLPQKLAAAGLKIISVDSRLHLNRGGDTLAQMMAESTRALQCSYVATGEVTPAEIEQYIENASDPQRWAVYYATVSVVAVNEAG